MKSPTIDYIKYLFLLFMNKNVGMKLVLISLKEIYRPLGGEKSSLNLLKARLKLHLSPLMGRNYHFQFHKTMLEDIVFSTKKDRGSWRYNNL